MAWQKKMNNETLSFLYCIVTSYAMYISIENKELFLARHKM